MLPPNESVHIVYIREHCLKNCQAGPVNIIVVHCDPVAVSCHGFHLHPDSGLCALRIKAGHHEHPTVETFGAFMRDSNRHRRHAQNICFFGYSAAVRKNAEGILLEMHVIKKTERFKDLDAVRDLNVEIRQLLAIMGKF